MDILWGIFCRFCCIIYWYPGTSQKSSYVPSIFIIKNQNKCQFWTLALLSLRLLSELQLPPPLWGTEFAFCASHLACWTLSTVHFCHCCIANGRTEVLALTRAAWMWMGSATTRKESSFEGPWRKVKATGGLDCFCWATCHAGFLDRSEHTDPFWGTSAIQADEQEQYWLLPMTLLLLLNVVV